MKEIYGNISSIETGFVDGPGVRAVVYMQGCPLRCLYCHNPENWCINVQKNLYTPKQLLEKIKRYKPYFGEDGGVTFSGGEPLVQSDFLLEVLKLCKNENIHTALDTSGSSKFNIEILNYIDLVILDIKAISSKEYVKITGKNIDQFNYFLQECQKRSIKLWLRQVIIPNINDKPEDIRNLKNFIKNINNVQKVELLPYHIMGKEKYKKLGIKYKLEETQPMDLKQIKELEKLLWE